MPSSVITILTRPTVWKLRHCSVEYRSRRCASECSVCRPNNTCANLRVARHFPRSVPAPPTALVGEGRTRVRKRRNDVPCIAQSVTCRIMSCVWQCGATFFLSVVRRTRRRRSGITRTPSERGVTCARADACRTSGTKYRLWGGVGDQTFLSLCHVSDVVCRYHYCCSLSCVSKQWTTFNQRLPSKLLWRSAAE